ncbi:MAG: hypothetical protein ACRCX7_11495 [Cetobacterium sp.]|uniref:hypothetical protein n=1 Tax=Cetobacterium sp. TaxID=2071632 RepID=UPI003F37111A
MIRYFINKYGENNINYANPFKSKDEAVVGIEKAFSNAWIDANVVVRADGIVEVFKHDESLVVLEVVKEDLGKAYIADIGKGSLLKAYFDSGFDAVMFMQGTYDTVDYDYENDLYHITHKDTFIGSFEVIGG